MRTAHAGRKRQADTRTSRRALLQMALVMVVSTAVAAPAYPQTRGNSARTQGKAPPAVNPPAVILGQGVDGLPPAVVDMRAAILAAVETGDIAELKGAMDLNELKPEFGGPPGVDPIGYLRSRSVDGAGKDVLAALAALLEGTWAAIPGGRDPENNRIYVWPRFAEVPPANLTGDERAALVALVGEGEAQAMIAAGRWRGWRLSIGADGVWHMFTEVK